MATILVVDDHMPTRELLRSLFGYKGHRVILAQDALKGRDSLTGLFNRRYLDDTLPRELRRCQRARTPLALIMLDLDHFKKINDLHGHLAGDEVLRFVAGVLRSSLRSEDIAARYGGEEFVLALPGATAEVALKRAHQIRELVIARTPCGSLPALRVTLSAGIAVYPAAGSDDDALLRAADAALYQAKEEGRDRVACHSVGRKP